jgi:serine O-acetyltransferase
MVSSIFGSAGKSLRWKRRLLLACQRRGWWRLSKLIVHHIQLRYGVFLPTRQMVPLSTVFPHPVCIVVGEGVRLGERCVIYQGVTCGGARRGDWQAGRYPIIGDNTVVFANASIVGPVTVGSNCTIGANAVVLRDVPDGHTAVGMPARIIPPKR